ncbi:MAG TPA: ATP-grasp domain-containing protein, partial [Prolixibacteraceae bacterium]|nr:ATP-grasp domain-containing protein [Prolixibacteraceae bacterium]
MLNQKPNVAVICGGDSSEFVISVKSGQNVYEAIDRERFIPWLVQMKGKEWLVVENGSTIGFANKSDFSLHIGNDIHPVDFAYITIHGTPGEDGILQGYFDLLKIPYSTGSVSSSALTFNKWHCNNFLRNFGVRMAKTIKLDRGEPIDVEAITGKLGLPVFVKPNAAGSSFGVTKVKNAPALENAVRHAWEESSEALIDQYISGTEFTCGVLKTGSKNLVFPVTEVLPKNEFFDFEAKYTPGVTEEITPARLPEKLFIECQYLSSRIYDWCGCSGIVRMDYILHNGRFYFLEVNTT